ncbi:hypothetical protein [Brevibacterium linens]|uniref:Lipoprotein n=1 Tax=Brevibacterium linens ATCC 9172 TaxID=1255617 RepID=A0A2H1HHS5_BRELN|nr:hypothetical protein [Brevibacterium linens]KAB1949427.1 hypothetical protein F8227_01955 [Brevibacterium linens ATCC 9172]SMX62410.1 hypothetical protein BLIN9172_00069 [Brevibacterium linens ATCC 9172]
MVSRTAVMTLPIVAALALAGCSGTDGDTAESTASASPETSTSAASAETTASAKSESETASAKASTEATGSDPDTSNDVKDLPEYIKPYPDSEVLSASIVKAHNDKDKKLPEQVSLTLRAEADAKDVFAFYEKELGKADFERLGDEVKTKSARVVNFKHKDNDSVLVVTVAEDSEDKANSIVTVGGNIG